MTTDRVLSARQANRFAVEWSALAPLVRDPNEHPWQLAALDPRHFRFPEFKAVAEVVCALRDAARRVHWRRVRRLALRRGGLRLWQVADDLRRVGAAGNMDFWTAALRGSP